MGGIDSHAEVSTHFASKMAGEQEMMALMGGAPGGTPGPGGAPVSAPMSTPQPNEGQQQESMVDISMAMDLLEKSLMAFGSESQQGKALLSALTTLSKSFGEQRQSGRDLQGAEIRSLMQSLPAGGGASPEMLSMMGAPGGGAPQSRLFDRLEPQYHP